jgi:hypothetical protein
MTLPLDLHILQIAEKESSTMAEKTQAVFDSAAGGKSNIKRITPFLYLLPAFIIMGVITFYPMGYQVWMSFTDYGIQNIRVDAPLPNFVGLKNYINILTTNLGLSSFNFWRTLAFNLWWTFSNVIFHVVFGIIIAVALNTEGLWFRRFYRVVYIIPIIIPQIIIANIFRNFLTLITVPKSGHAISWRIIPPPPEMFHIRWISQVDYPFANIPHTFIFCATHNERVVGMAVYDHHCNEPLQSIPKEPSKLLKSMAQQVGKILAYHLLLSASHGPRSSLRHCRHFQPVQPHLFLSEEVRYGRPKFFSPSHSDRQ